MGAPRPPTASRNALNPAQTDMLKLIQASPADGDKGHVTMLYSLNHPQLTRTMTDDARLNYIDNLYDSMRTRYQTMVAKGQVAHSGQSTHGSGLVGERRHEPQHGKSTATTGRTPQQRSIDVGGRVMSMVHDAMQSTLGRSSLPSGKVSVSVTVGSNGHASQVRITSAGLGLDSEVTAAVNAAITRNIRSLEFPESMRGNTYPYSIVLVGSD